MVLNRANYSTHLPKVEYLDLNQAKEFLESDRAIAERKARILDKLKDLDKGKGAALEEFISDWPLYVDGDRHLALRRPINRAVGAFEASNKEERQAHFDELFSRFLSPKHISSYDIHELCKVWHGDLFGISVEESSSIIHAMIPILDVILVGKVEYLDAAYAALLEIRKIVNDINPRPGKLLHLLREKGCSLNTVINVIIDSFKPTENALQLVMYEIFKGESSFFEDDVTSARGSILHLLSVHPPFRYINRLDRGNDMEWIKVDIATCARGNHAGSYSDLAFGLGPHQCPGKSPVVSLLIAFAQALGQIKASRKFHFEGDRVDIEGMCLVRKLVLEWWE